jgi:PAS domain S-box-containing protein
VITDERPFVPPLDHQPRALVVDDEIATAELYGRVLRKAGIDVVIAHDGKSALEILRYDSINLLILDRHMPGLGGLEVIERLRAEPATVHLPVILVTGDTDLTDRVYGLEHGADDYLSKPVELDELVARARSQLRRRSPDDGIRQFVESANDAFVSWDATGVITEWTTQAEALFGWTRSEKLGEPFSTVLAPRHRIVHALRMERLLQVGERPLLGQWFELCALRNDGREIPIEMTVSIVSSRGYHNFNAFIRDLEKRNAIEDALHDRAQLQAVVGAVTDVIILTDLLGVIVYSSPSAQTVLGFEPDELYGHLFDEFVHAADQAVCTRMLGRAVESRSEILGTQRLRTRDGAYVWMESMAAVVSDIASGELTGVEIVSRDITSRKLADDARKRATADLSSMIADLRTAIGRERETVEELRVSDRLKSDLVSTVSHELRTPLTSISAYAELLADPSIGTLSSRQRSMLEVVERNTNRLLAMIENLSTIGGIDSHATGSPSEPIELMPIVNTAILAIQPSADEAGVEIQLDLALETGCVLADASQLDSVLLNLLSNAIKFSDRGATITVSSRRLAGEVEVIVADTGIGIPIDEQAHLFTPFFRSRIALEREVPGSGLGLVIVKRLIDRLGGTIDVRSTPGDGTAVIFTIPTGADVPADAGDAIEESA